MSNELIRCGWCGADDVYTNYHDTEWGVPEWDSRALFEKLILDGFQAGLAWITILRKREGFRAAFAGFEPERIARFGEADITRLVADAGIVRHRGKIEATIGNARAYLAMAEKGVDFSDYLWSFVDGKPRINHWTDLSQVPARTDQGNAMSKALIGQGFRFVGPTIVYAFMQAVGMVNDHVTTCHRHAPLAEAGRA